MRVDGGGKMTQLIVPALPVERVQYERAYVLGLEAMMKVIRQLTTTEKGRQVPTNQFPVFAASYDVPQALAQVAVLKAATTRLKVRPIQLTVTRQYVTLRFQLQAAAGQPVWVPSAGALWRLYDGFLSNLVGIPFQHLANIQIGLQRVTGPLTVTTPIRPSFQNYDVRLTPSGQTGCLVKIHKAPAILARRAPIYQLSHYSETIRPDD